MTIERQAVDDLGVAAVWDRLSRDRSAHLIDVRTAAEWSYVGLPDLSSLDKDVICVEWLTFPGNAPNAGFVGQIRRELESRGIGPDADLYFICRSGARSKQAAVALCAAGYGKCHNVADGFEGPLDAEGHRGGRAGWKAAGLPWRQG